VRTELLGGRDHRAAVAGAEIDDVIVRRHLRHLQHAFDQRLRRWHPDHILAFLTDGGRELLLGGRGRLRENRATECANEQQQAEGPRGGLENLHGGIS
jgi:hypothetical protein